MSNESNWQVNNNNNNKPELEVGKAYIDSANNIVNIVYKKKDGTFIGLFQDVEYTSIWSQYGAGLEGQRSLVKEYVAPKKVKVEFWVNVYPGTNCGVSHSSKDYADNAASPGRLDCVHFEQEYEVPG